MKRSKISNLLVFLFISSSIHVHADTTEDLIDALVTKGVLTEDEAALLSKGNKAEKKKLGNVKKGSGFEFVSPDGNSNMKVSGRVQLDWRHFSEVDESSASSDNFDIRRAYFGVSGKYNKYIGYKFNASFDSSTKLDVAWLNLGYFKPAQLLFGQFKTSMSLEERTSSRFLNFTERSYVNNASLTEGKDKGVMLHGSPKKGINYSLAVVNGYGQNNDTSDAGDDNFKFIAHIDTDLATVNKWKNKVFHLGANFATHDLDVSNYMSKVGISQSTIGKGEKFFSAATNDATKTDLTNFGLEAAFASGPYKIQAEYATAEFDSDTNKQDIDAYYIEAGWLITGENYSKSYKSKSAGGKFDRIKPNSNFNPKNGKGIGAWELMLGASRFDASDFTSSSSGYSLSSNYSNEADSWRAGLKWILDPNTRMMLSYIDTDFDTAINSTNDTNEKAINLRAQFDF